MSKPTGKHKTKPKMPTTTSAKGDTTQGEKKKKKKEQESLRTLVPRETAKRVDAEVAAAYQHFRNVVRHNGDYGALLETLLREAVRPRLKEGLCVSSGYVRASDAASPQTDVLVFDRRKYPELFAEGQVALVRAETVVVIVEVKADVRTACNDTFDHLAWYAFHCRSALTVAFGFKGWASEENFCNGLRELVARKQELLFTATRRAFYAPDIVVNGSVAIAVKDIVTDDAGVRRWGYRLYSPPEYLRSSGAGAAVACIESFASWWQSTDESARRGPAVSPLLLDPERLWRPEYWISTLEMKEYGVLTFCKALPDATIQDACEATVVTNGDIRLHFPQRLVTGNIPDLCFFLPIEHPQSSTPLVVHQYFVSQLEFAGKLLVEGSPYTEPIVIYWCMTGVEGSGEAASCKELDIPVATWPKLEPHAPLTRDVTGEHVIVIHSKGRKALHGKVKQIFSSRIELSHSDVSPRTILKKIKLQEGVQVETVAPGSGRFVSWKLGVRVIASGKELARDDVFDW